MISSEVQRTLVKSPPELWAELSDPAALARHLGELGDIRIVRTEPEKTVEWAAENTSGTVSIQPSGWGTNVKLTVTREVEEPAIAAAPEPEPATNPTPEPEIEIETQPRRGFFARLFRRRLRAEPLELSEAQTDDQVVQPAPVVDLSAELMAAEEVAAAEVTAVLTAVLDRLGAAHHRPFSRA